ncbi:thrombospondin type 3 repeat-containing protein, partial [Patescibacteria group bacterium]|nr:thrombospondin type 3 repeat-containing protein [Patescibacteria group bacterium]
MKLRKLSKKLNILVVIFVLLIGISIGVYLVLESRTGDASINEQLSQIFKKNTEPITGCQPNPNDKNKDSDNDGLMDWQETIWRTDPCKPDSDSDGYLDGEEVTSGYNPIKPAPNDELPGQDQTNPRALPNNITQALAQELSRQIIEGKMGLISDASSPLAINASNRVVNAAIQEVMNKAIQEFSLPNIPDEEITISSDNSIIAIENYAKRVVNVIDYWAKTTSIDQNKLYETENEIFYYAIQNNDFTEFYKYIKFYKELSKNIKQIPVPSDLKEIHKEQIGIFTILANIYQAIKNIENDPLKASLALEQYENTIELTTQMLIKLSDYID